VAPRETKRPPRERSEKRRWHSTKKGEGCGGGEISEGGGNWKKEKRKGKGGWRRWSAKTGKRKKKTNKVHPKKIKVKIAKRKALGPIKKGRKQGSPRPAGWWKISGTNK